MTPPTDRAAQLAALHVPGEPLVLYNAWDVGTARAIRKAGAEAIGTSSWAVAAAQGFPDGEAFPFERLVELAERIVLAVDAPVTVDVEGGYATSPADVASNVARLIDAGVAGINLEDRIIGGRGLYPIDEQSARLAAVREAAGARRSALFINARTDVFFGAREGDTRSLADEVVERSAAYAAAGASGLFVPGLVDDALIGQIRAEIGLPLNVMASDGLSPMTRLAELGVARVSYGARPYLVAIHALQAAAAAELAVPG